MTPDERNLLTGFLNDLAQARAGAKDPDADALIRNAISSNPDAAYLLVQHSILSDQALHAAQEQISQLQAQLQSTGQPAPQASFFGGSRPSTSVPPTAGYGAPPPQPQPQGQWGGPPPQPPGQGMWGAPPPQPFSGGGGGLGSFLRNAGTMAAGVAGGEFLFSGLHGLFGGGRGGGFGGGFGGAPVENVTVNEYNEGGGDYDDGGDGDYGDDGDDGGDDGGY